MQQRPGRKVQTVTPRTCCRLSVRFSGVASNPFVALRRHWRRAAFQQHAAVHGRPSRSLTFCGGLAEFDVRQGQNEYAYAA